VKFDYAGGLLCGGLSVFYGLEDKLTATIGTGSAGTAAGIGEFNMVPHRQGSRLEYIVGDGGRQRVTRITWCCYRLSGTRDNFNQADFFWQKTKA